MNFDQFKELLRKFDKNQARLGVFEVEINHNKKRYDFLYLKMNKIFGNDIFALSLNHYKSFSLPMPKNEVSIFDDGESICIDILRKDFISATEIGKNKFSFEMKDWSAIISW